MSNRIPPDRQCAFCTKAKTFVKKGKYAQWYKYDGGFICQNCHDSLKRGRPRRRIPTDRKCALCASPKTSIENGHAHWRKYGEDFICAKCFRIVNGAKLRYHISADRKCSKCQEPKTEFNKKGYAHWFNDGNGGFWCRKCYVEERKKRPQVRERLRRYMREHAKGYRKRPKVKKYFREYLAAYRATNKAKAEAYARLPHIKKANLEHKRLPEVKMARNLRLRQFRKSVSSRIGGDLEVYQFLEKAKEMLSRLPPSNKVGYRRR